MTATDVTAPGVDERSLRSLRGWNLALTVLHLAQAVAVVVLAAWAAPAPPASSRAADAATAPTRTTRRRAVVGVRMA